MNKHHQRGTKNIFSRILSVFFTITFILASAWANSEDLNICSYPNLRPLGSTSGMTGYAPQAANTINANMTEEPEDRFWPWNSEDFHDKKIGADASQLTWEWVNGVWSYHKDKVEYPDSSSVCKTMLAMQAKSDTGNENTYPIIKAKLFSPIDCSIIASGEGRAEERMARLTLVSQAPKVRALGRYGQSLPTVPPIEIVLRSFRSTASTPPRNDGYTLSARKIDGLLSNQLITPAGRWNTDNNNNRVYEVRYTRIKRRSELVKIPQTAFENSAIRANQAISDLNTYGFSCNNRVIPIDER